MPTHLSGMWLRCSTDTPGSIQHLRVDIVLPLPMEVTVWAKRLDDFSKAMRCSCGGRVCIVNEKRRAELPVAETSAPAEVPA